MYLSLLVPLFKSHLLKPLLPVELVVAGVGAVAEVLHVRPDQHLPQLREVAVVLILHLKYNDEHNEAAASLLI